MAAAAELFGVELAVHLAQEMKLERPLAFGVEADQVAHEPQPLVEPESAYQHDTDGLALARRCGRGAEALAVAAVLQDAQPAVRDERKVIDDDRARGLRGRNESVARLERLGDTAAPDVDESMLDRRRIANPRLGDRTRAVARGAMARAVDPVLVDQVDRRADGEEGGMALNMRPVPAGDRREREVPRNPIAAQGERMKTESGLRCLVTGGAGYVGSHTCKTLARAGYLPIVYDNLSRGHSSLVKWGKLEIGDLADTGRFFWQHSSIEIIGSIPF